MTPTSRSPKAMPDCKMNVALTGGARGIGRGLVRLLLQEGHSVYALDSNQAELHHTRERAKEWASSGKGVFHCKLVDLSDRQALHASVKDISAAFDNKLDLLINNAFATPHTWTGNKSVDDIDADIEEQWDHKVAVGLTAPFVLSRLCTSMLKSGDNSTRRPGSIINIASTRAHQSEDNHEAYSACKAGLLGLTQSMAVSLGHKHNIRVNAISPGWISVDNENKEADEKGVNWEDGMSDQDHRWHPAGRVGKVEDIHKAVTFLAESEFVTGQEIVVDGGVTKKMVYPE
jgi:NAD(P)-dependent dehydrogenase (short-subunit alcohol dehydrogenase family)